MSCVFVFLKVLFMSSLFILLSGMNHYTAGIRHIHVHFWMKTSVVKFAGATLEKPVAACLKAAALDFARQIKKSTACEFYLLLQRAKDSKIRDL